MPLSPPRWSLGRRGATVEPSEHSCLDAPEHSGRPEGSENWDPDLWCLFVFFSGGRGCSWHELAESGP